MLKTLFYFAWLEIIRLFSFSISSEVIFQLIKSFDLKALKKLLVSGNKLLTGVFLCQIIRKKLRKIIRKTYVQINFQYHW